MLIFEPATVTLSGTSDQQSAFSAFHNFFFTSEQLYFTNSTKLLSYQFVLCLGHRWKTVP